MKSFVKMVKEDIVPHVAEKITDLELSDLRRLKKYLFVYASSNEVLETSRDSFYLLVNKADEIIALKEEENQQDVMVNEKDLHVDHKEETFSDNKNEKDKTNLVLKGTHQLLKTENTKINNIEFKSKNEKQNESKKEQIQKSNHQEINQNEVSLNKNNQQKIKNEQLSKEVKQETLKTENTVKINTLQNGLSQVAQVKTSPVSVDIKKPQIILENGNKNSSNKCAGLSENLNQFGGMKLEEEELLSLEDGLYMEENLDINVEVNEAEDDTMTLPFQFSPYHYMSNKKKKQYFRNLNQEFTKKIQVKKRNHKIQKVNINVNMNKVVLFKKNSKITNK